MGGEKAMDIEITNVITAICSIATWLAGEKFLFPQLVNIWNWIINRKRENDEHNINATKEVFEVKEAANNAYEEQITFFMTQIRQLEEELLNYQEQLGKLRTKILELNNQLYANSLEMNKYKHLCCMNESCQFRQSCSDFNSSKQED